MVPYVLLIFVPLFCSVLVLSRNTGKNKNDILLVGNSRKILDNSMLIPVFFLMLLMLLCFRDEAMGRDLDNYRYYFERYIHYEFKELFQEDLDILYVLLNWLIGRCTDNYQFFLAVVSVITILPIARVYGRDREHGFLKIMLFMNMSVFVLLFSGLRQAIAISLGLIAYECVVKRKTIWFFLISAIAFGFHHSAFILLSYYPLYYITLKKKHMWFVIPVIVVFYIFNRPIFNMMTSLVEGFLGAKYEVAIGITGAYTMILLFIMLAVFSYVVSDEKKMDRETMGLRNILLMAVILQCFAPIHNLAMRMNYYFIIFIPILMPKILKYAKTEMKQVAKVAKYIMIVFFVFYYLITTYNSCRTGISALDIYPYVPFWK